jgi:hypothetical protein
MPPFSSLTGAAANPLRLLPGNTRRLTGAPMFRARMGAKCVMTSSAFFYRQHLLGSANYPPLVSADNLKWILVLGVSVNHIINFLDKPMHGYDSIKTDTLRRIYMNSKSTFN